MIMKTKKVKSASVLGAIALTLAVTSCSSSTPAGAAASGSKPKNNQVSFVAAQMTSTYFAVMECGAKAAAKKYQVNLDWQGASDWDIHTQIPLINAAEQRQPAGMVLVPTDPVALGETVSKIMADHIPVITVDGSLNKPVELQNIRTENTSAGALAADALAASMGEAGTVLVIASFPGVAANAERVDGFVKQMAKAHPNITVRPTEYSKADQATASQITAAALTNPNLKGIYTTLEPASAGAAAAIRAAGKIGKVKLVAYDADATQVKDLKAGVYDALVAQDPYGLGYDSVERIAQIISGHLDPKTLTYQTYVKAFIITRANADTKEAQAHIYVPTC